MVGTHYFECVYRLQQDVFLCLTVAMCTMTGTGATRVVLQGQAKYRWEKKEKLQAVEKKPLPTVIKKKEPFWYWVP